jgi:hypothetical protein
LIPAPVPAEALADLWNQNKCYRSGEAGRDIGIEAAIRDWLQNHAPKG